MPKFSDAELTEALSIHRAKLVAENIEIAKNCQARGAGFFADEIDLETAKKYASPEQKEFSTPKDWARRVYYEVDFKKWWISNPPP